MACRSRCARRKKLFHLSALTFICFVLCKSSACAEASLSLLDHYNVPQVSVGGIESYFHNPPQSHLLDHQLDVLVSNRQIDGSRFVGPSASSITVPLTNGTSDAQISWIFIPEEGFTIEDYNLVPSFDNERVATADDVSLLVVEDRSEDFLAYNVTAEIDFNKWVGVSDFSISALSPSTSAGDTASESSQLTVSGITFYTRDENGAETIVGDSRRPLMLTSDQVAEDPNVNLDVLVQYVDGSSSTSSLSIPFTGLTLSTGDVSRQIDYSPSCSPTSGVYSGADVELPEPCDMGFSTNNVGGEYVGPKYGFDLNKYENGTFFAYVEWNEILEGSDVEDEGYENFLQVDITGEVPPVVYFITPDGPFNSLGTAAARLNIANLPTDVDVAELWQFDLAIDFPEGTRRATFEDGSIIIHENNTLSLLFTLPAGSGVDLPWQLTVTKPTGEDLLAVDETDPSYLFNFIAELVIESISPAEGPQEGGTQVTLEGEFLGADNDSGTVDILFDGVAIDRELITSIEPTAITFTSPVKGDDSSFEVPVVVQIGDIVSNPITFTYVPDIRIISMVPSAGPPEGGTTVTLSGQFLEFNPAADSNILFGDTSISSALIQSFNDTTIVFNTADQSTLSTSVFSYNVTVQVNGETSNPALFTYNAPVIIETIEPSSGAEEGGTEVVLSGQFVNFDPSSSSIIIGSKELDGDLITSYNETQIQFLTPALSEVGLSHIQTVKVTIESFESNEVEFTYLESVTRLSIEGGGGNIDPSNGNYRLGACSDGLFRVLVSSGSRTRVETYQWTLIEDGTNVNILPSNVQADSDVILLPHTALPKQEVPYLLTIIVTTDSATFEQSLTVLRLSQQAISVFIVDPRARSPSDPNVTLTIPAIISSPECENADFTIEATAMTFEWKFQGEEYVFSYLNKTAPEDEISPTLLGREFNIPQSRMSYGSFPLSLKASFTEQDTISGSDSSIVVISPAPLVAQINGGEESQFISESQDFTLSAAQSRDPDVLDGERSADLTFLWSCRLDFDASFDSAEPCGDALLPPNRIESVDFTLSSEDLAALQNETSDVHIEYSLQVRKVSLNATGSEIQRASSDVSSTLVLPQQAALVFEPLSRIDILNNQSAEIDRSSVKYYEALTITPVSETPETTWTFRLLAPFSQIRTLLASDDNLLTFPGYFTVGAEAGRYSLGLKANVLSPNTEYIFLISTFRTGFAVNEQTFSLTTVERPEVTLGKIPTPSGDTNDTYALSASANYDGDFRFFFLLTDDFGFESCVGGCQGTGFIRFRLATPGVYSVKCDVYDSLGHTLLATTSATENITVTQAATSITDLSLFSGDVDNAFLAGDHADFQQLGTDMVKFILSNGGSASADLDSETLRNFTEGLNQVASNAIPNSIQSAGFVRTAAALASLTPDLGISYDTASLYFLVNITVSAVERTPDTAAMQQLQDLLDFYDLTPELVLASYSGGTTRVRMVQVANAVDEEVLDLWLDLYETMKRQLTFVALSGCSCGCIVELQTGVSSRSRDALSLRMGTFRQESSLTAAASYTNPTQDAVTQVRMTLAHFCNEEQGNQIVLNEGLEDEILFRWCKLLYEETIKKLYFSLARTPNYISLSGLRTNVTLTDGLVGTTVGRLEQNDIVDATLPIENCYEIKVPIPREVARFPADAPFDQHPKGMFLAPRKQWGVSATEELYWPIFSGIDTRIDNTSTQASSFASATLKGSRTGVVSVGTRFGWGLSGMSLEGILLIALEVGGVVLSILVLVLMGVAGSWVLASGAFGAGQYAPPVEMDFTYVERDVYGRGTAIDIIEEQGAIPETRNG